MLLPFSKDELDQFDTPEGETFYVFQVNRLRLLADLGRRTSRCAVPAR